MRLVWISFEAFFEVLAHAGFEDVYVVLEPHEEGIDATEEEDGAHCECCGFEAQLHLLFVLLVEALQSIVLVSGKSKGVILLVHIKAKMKKYIIMCI